MKKWILIIMGILLFVIVAVVGGGYVWFQQTVKKSLPQTGGEVSLPGLRNEVKIVRDRFGVPHIYAQNEPDLYYALGYAMAQDRLWQMEFHRRLGNGRLSEVFGEDFVKADRYFRMLTASGVNKEVPPELSFMLQSFTDGINAYLETQRDRLPMEFKLLRYKPERWGLDDYLAILKVINWSLSSGWRTDLTAAKILEKVGEDKLREAFPVWPKDAPLIIPKENRALAALTDPSFETIRSLERLTAFPTPAASNNWVVSGEKSITGKPILANDPHLVLSNPSFWWEVHAVCPSMDVAGFAVPGVPGVPVGHNRHVAWGVTNVMVDDVDFYIEKINPENPRQYWFKDRWEDMKVLEETILVKGKDAVKTEILLTRHGPIVTEVKAGSKENVISARWAFTEGLQPGRAAYLLAKAEDIEGVKDALRYWVLPSQNFVFADVKGNIGYWCCATVPIRSKGDGILPMPGWTGEYEWEGYVPFEDRPSVINPAEGFIATANNKVAADSFPYLIGHYWEPADRITRIRQLLKGKDKLSVDDFKRIQNDVYCVLASQLTPKIIDVIQVRLSGAEANKAKDILSGWDFVMAKDSVAACLYEVTFRKMMDNIFKDELGDELFRAYLKAVSFPPRAISLMVRKGASAWFDDVSTAEKETLEDIIAKSFQQSLSELEDLVGSDMMKWTWGRLHQLTFQHVLGKKKPLDRLFNLGPFPIEGNNLTINKRQYDYTEPYNTVHGVSERMIVDMSNTSEALHVLPTGESGLLGSPHYEDQIELYLGGQYHPLRMNREEVEKRNEGTLVLKPKMGK